jgi:hypothetical protein
MPRSVKDGAFAGLVSLSGDIYYAAKRYVYLERECTNDQCGGALGSAMAVIDLCINTSLL